MFVKPREGFVVRDPKSKQALPPEGRDVPDTVYWRRRIKAGDAQIPDSAEVSK